MHVMHANNYLLTGKSETLFHRDELEIFYVSSEARKIIIRVFIEVK